MTDPERLAAATAGLTAIMQSPGVILSPQQAEYLRSQINRVLGVFEFEREEWEKKEQSK